MGEWLYLFLSTSALVHLPPPVYDEGVGEQAQGDTEGYLADVHLH